MNEVKSDRRGFLIKSAGLVAASLLASATLPSLLKGQEGSQPTGQEDATGFTMTAATVKHCGTCEFWGGPRRLSSDGKTITITGLGWCNNPKSPIFQKVTTPDHGPMDTWRKWGALG